MVWSCRFRYPFQNPGKREKELGEGSSRNKSSNVNEEYIEAFRTNSYVEMCNNVTKTLNDVGPSSSHSPHRQEALADLITSSNFHHLIIDYFQVGLGACKLCQELLQIVRQTRFNHRAIKRVLKLAKTRVDDDDHDTSNTINGRIIAHLATYSLINNPLSSFSPAKLHDIQCTHGLLFKKLTSKYRRIRRRMKLIQILKKFMGCALVVSCTALSITLLVLAIHSMVGIMVSPALIGLMMKKQKQKVACRKREELERLGKQLDVAARGVYTLINDFDTMSRVGWRLYDEIEHGKAIADMCVKNGKGEVLKEVVREFQSHESFFLELLEEFEKHIYLCLLNVNRSARQLKEELH